MPANDPHEPSVKWPSTGTPITFTCVYCGAENRANVPEEGTTTVTHVCRIRQSDWPVAMKASWSTISPPARAARRGARDV